MILKAKVALISLRQVNKRLVKDALQMVISARDGW